MGKYLLRLFGKCPDCARLREINNMLSEALKEERMISSHLRLIAMKECDAARGISDLKKDTTE